MHLLLLLVLHCYFYFFIIYIKKADSCQYNNKNNNIILLFVVDFYIPFIETFPSYPHQNLIKQSFSWEAIMQYIELIGFDILYKTRYRTPNWVKIHRSILYSFQFSKLKRNQISAYIALVFLAIETENEIIFDIKWINSRTFCKIRTSDIVIFQALRLITLRDREEEKRIEEKRIEENRSNTTKSFLSNLKTEDSKTSVKEKINARYERLTDEEVEEFKKNFRIDLRKYARGLVKSV